VMWKGTIEPGTSNALVSQMDLPASFAAFTGQKKTTEDTQNVIDAMLGKSDK